MIIEDIKYNKKSANLTIDGEVYERVSLATLIQYGFKRGMEVNVEKLNAFLADSHTQNAKDYLMNLLAKGARTEKDCLNKLTAKGYPTKSIEEAIKLAKSYNYISDEKYAQNYIDNFSAVKGKYRLKRELKQKGVSEEIIENALADAEVDEKESAIYVMEKFMRGKTLDEKTKLRLFRHLAARGFGYDTIRGAINTLGADIDYD